jgi:Aromatic acid exporter family member 1
MRLASTPYRGPVAHLARKLLSASWPGTRVLKSAAAAGLAWWAAGLLGDAAPLFAVFGALNGLQPTIAASLRHTGGALLGILLGTVLAVMSEAIVDAPRAVTVALLVALGLLVALRLHAYTLLGTEVAVTGVLVFALSQGSLLWAVGRFGETALGGAIAILINALVLPPDYRHDARRATQMLAGELVVHLRTALIDIVQPPTVDDARAHLIGAGAAVQVAEESLAQTQRAREALRFNPLLRYSPLGRASATDIERYVTGVQALTSSMTHARAACRAVWHASRRPERLPRRTGDWEGLLATVEPALSQFERYLLHGESALEAADVAIQHALRKHAEVVSAVTAAGEPWGMDQASVLAETERILDDLRRALRRQQAPSQF